jgi:hypothetical protein
MLVRAMVIAAGTPGGAYQADILRSYLGFPVPRGARSAFYRWFDEPLEQFMAALADRALRYARTQQVDLTGMLGGVQDWYIVDATTGHVRDALRDEFPGAGDYAAVKVHKVLSVGCGAPVHYHFSPDREHDSRHGTIDESWRGCGLLADLAYASLARWRACNDHGVRLVIRLKDNWKPKVDHLARGHVSQEFCPGTDLDTLLAQDVLGLDGWAIDAAGHVGRTKCPLHLRLVGVHTPKWSIKLDQSVHRLDEVDAERPCSVKMLWHASLISSIITALPGHTHHRQTGPAHEGEPRTEAPLHPRRLALQLAVSCQSIAQAFDLRGAEAMRRWDKIAALLTHSGKDPNWRRQPSVLDQWRGGKRQPLARKKTNGGNVNHPNFKAAA